MLGNKAKAYNISLDLELASKLRATVNNRVNISIKRKQTLEKKQSKLYPAWNRICAIMDRIEDTAYYLNDLVVSSSEDKRVSVKWHSKTGLLLQPRSAFIQFVLLSHPVERWKG